MCVCVCLGVGVHAQRASLRKRGLVEEITPRARTPRQLAPQWTSRLHLRHQCACWLLFYFFFHRFLLRKKRRSVLHAWLYVQSEFGVCSAEVAFSTLLCCRFNWRIHGSARPRGDPLTPADDPVVTRRALAVNHVAPKAETTSAAR